MKLEQASEKGKGPVFSDELPEPRFAEPGAVGRVKDPWDEAEPVLAVPEATPKRDKYAGHVPPRRTYRKAG